MRSVFWGILLCCIFRTDAAYKVKLVSGGFSSPVVVTAPPGDVTRLFVVEQFTARIMVYDRVAKAILGTPFLTVPFVNAGDGEQGLLGLAFHPNYANNGLFYVNYTATGGGAAGHTEITEFRVNGSPASSNVADPSSRRVLLTYNQPESNHNGGWLGFGVEGFLYISTGDGGGGNDQHGTIGNAQDRTSLLGKILRIDVNGTPYLIPPGNPYANHATFRKEIWQWGLRNPWRCSIDRGTGDLWIGDVGQGAREEIDYAPFGSGDLNFGWRPREGTIATPGISETPQTTATDPVFDYNRTTGTTVTGGYVYRGTRIPELQGIYIFADFGNGKFWTINHSGSTFTTQEQTSTFNPSSGGLVGNPSSFGEDGVGELFICDYSDGQILSIDAVHPIASNDSFVRQRGVPGKIHINILLANDSDSIGHPLTIQSVSALSANNASVTLDGNWVIYNPPAGFNGADTFTYTLADNEGSTATATVNVIVASASDAQTLNIVSATPSGNNMVIVCAGIPGRGYQIQTSPSLDNPVWTPHPSGQLVAGANGTFELTDVAPPSPRFYRAIQTNP